MIRDVVLEVSLRAYADRIINVDKHNRRAFLEFEINGSRAHDGARSEGRGNVGLQRLYMTGTMSMM